MSEKNAISFLDRPFAFVDVETTGTDPHRHEIVEIGLVLVEQKSLAVISEWSAKTHPVRPENFDPAALAICGYNTIGWRDAITLQEAMRQFAALVPGAVFAAHNVTFDWGFVSEAFRQTGVADPMDYHRLDLFSIAWDRLRDSGLERFNQGVISEHLGLGVEPNPHCALNGARMAHEVFKKLHAAGPRKPDERLRETPAVADETGRELRIPSANSWRHGIVSTLLVTTDYQGLDLRALVWISANDGGGLALHYRTPAMPCPDFIPLALLAAQTHNCPEHMPIVSVGQPAVPLFTVKSVDLKTGSVRIVLDQLTKFAGFVS